MRCFFRSSAARIASSMFLYVAKGTGQNNRAAATLAPVTPFSFSASCRNLSASRFQRTIVRTRGWCRPRAESLRLGRSTSSEDGAAKPDHKGSKRRFHRCPPHRGRPVRTIFPTLYHEKGSATSLTSFRLTAWLESQHACLAPTATEKTLCVCSRPPAPLLSHNVLYAMASGPDFAAPPGCCHAPG